mgnify:CR=1 FL=1
MSCPEDPIDWAEWCFIVVALVIMAALVLAMRVL